MPHPQDLCEGETNYNLFSLQSSKEDLVQLLLVACYWQDQKGKSNTEAKQVNPNIWRKNTEKNSHQVNNIFSLPTQVGVTCLCHTYAVLSPRISPLANPELLK